MASLWLRGKLLLSALLLLVASAARGDDLMNRYLEAVEDAKRGDPSRVVNDLQPIVPGVGTLEWEGEPGASRVRVLTWTGYTGYDSLVGQETTLPPVSTGIYVWVSPTPQTRQFMAGEGLTPDTVTLRMEQRIGLPPGNGKTRFVEFYVDPEDLFRPAADPRIDTTTAGYDFPPGVPQSHIDWYNTDWQSAYESANKMPWTRLGYTYDWGIDTANHEGQTEYVIYPSSTVKVVSVITTMEYAYYDGLGNFDVTGDSQNGIKAGAGFTPEGSWVQVHEGATVGGVGVRLGSGTYTVTNRGTIAVTGDAVRFTNAAGLNDLGGAVDNYGVIRSDTGYGIRLGSGTVFNHGTLGGALAAVRFTGATSSSFANWGTVDGDVVMSSAADAVSLYGGTIHGDVLCGDGDDLVTVATDVVMPGNIDGQIGFDTLRTLGNFRCEGDIRNFEQIEFGSGNVQVANVNGNVNVGAGSVLHTPSGTAIVGQVDVGQNGQVDLQGNVVGDLDLHSGGVGAINGTVTGTANVRSGARMAGSGTVVGTLANSGTVAPGNSIGQLNVAGSYVESAGSTLEVEINDAGQGDRITVTGTPGRATLNGGTVEVLPEVGEYQAGTTYTLLTASGGISGAFDGATDPFYFLDAVLDYEPTEVRLVLDRNAVTYASVAHTANQAAVGTLLDRIAPVATGDLGVVVGSINTLSASWARSALEQMSGELYGTLSSVLLENSTQNLRSISSRLRQFAAGAGPHGVAGVTLASSAGSNGGELPLWLTSRTDDPACAATEPLPPASCSECAAPTWGGWILGYGLAGDVQSDGNARGFGYSIGGTGVAIERQLTDDTLVGLTAGHAGSRVDADRAGNDADVETTQLGFYGRHISECYGYMMGIATFGYDDYDTIRRIGFGTIAREATADYHGCQIAGYLETGTTLSLLETGDLQPLTALQYVFIRHEGFTEGGAGALNLTVDGDGDESLRGILGSRLSRVWRTCNGAVIEPELRALYMLEFLNADRLVVAELGGSGHTFLVRGADLGRNFGVFGAGLNTFYNKNVSLFVDYNVQLGAHQTYHVGSGGVQFAW